MTTAIDRAARAMARTWWFIRCAVGRWLMLLGLAIWPAGQAKSDLIKLITAWKEHVYRTIGESEMK